jgi:membrane protease YdiL (CAAX protease family)
MRVIGALRDKRFVLTGLLALVSLLFLGFFRESDRVSPVLQGYIVGLVFFLVVPLIYCKMILKEPLSALGFEKGKALPGFFWGLVGIAAASGVLLALDRFTGLLSGYRFPASVERSFVGFILYETIVVVLTVLMYEVFFRGLVMRIWLGPVIGFPAVLVQAVLFGALLFSGGSLEPAQAPFLLASLFSGLTVYFSRSLWYGLLVSWAIVFLSDIFVLITR